MERTHKGKSLIALPSNFTLIDLETTGLSPEYDEIIEVSALRVRDFKVVDEFSSLVQPSEEIDDFIEELTGITNEMLRHAKTISSVMPEFLNFIGSDIVVGHNVNFDINFIYDKSIYFHFFSNDFVDTMRLSRFLRKDERHHRLTDVCKRYNISNPNAHRALSDCHTTFECYEHIREEINSRFGNVENFIKSNRRVHFKANDIIADVSKNDETSLLYEKVCVFTGVLEKMTRKEAMQLVADIGGFVADSVTKKTNFLVLGNNDYSKSIKGGKSTKQKKAEKLKLSGQDIEVISEDVFYDILNIEE